MVIANFLKFCFITTNTSIHTMMMVMMIMMKIIWMMMVIANVSIILFNYHRHWHTHQDIRDDGYDDHEGDWMMIVIVLMQMFLDIC